MEFENICTECGAPFLTNDSDMNYCDKCWEKIVEKMVETDNKGTFKEDDE